MVLLWPASLLGLVLVGAVAAWALLRPSRQLAVVGSLALWEEALAALDRSARRRSRLVDASWALLLAGAATAVLALARPVLHTRGQGRVISIAICPSAELAGDAQELPRAVDALLARLDAADRVEVLLPQQVGGVAGLLSLAEARVAVARLAPVPVPAGGLTWPLPDPASAHTYRFVPAGAPPQLAGPRTTIIELPLGLPPVTFDAAGAADLGAGRAQLFLAVRNAGPAAWQGRISLKALPEGPGAQAWQALADLPVEVGPGERRAAVQDVPAVAAYRAELSVGQPWPAAVAFLVRREAQKRKVAMVGPDEPLLRQFIRADETMELVTSAGDADLVIANRAPPPAGKPALVIDPPTPPPLWQAAPEVRAVVLDRASVAADDPVMRDVDLRAAAVRRVRPWTAAQPQAGRVLAALDGKAILVRNEPAGLPGEPPRRIDVAFELSWANTNLAKTEAFVVLLANAVRWLAPGGAARPTYGWIAPAEAPRAADWVRLADPTPAPAGELPWPGIYRDGAGSLHAVSLLGLSGGLPAKPAAQAVADAPLPAPQPIARPIELWAFLAAAAVALWLAGWAARLR